MTPYVKLPSGKFQKVILGIKPDISRHIGRETRYIVLDRQKWRCNICDTRLRFNSESEYPGEVAHIDHIHPFSKRKSYPNGEFMINEEANLQALCPSCNMMKHKKEIN